MTFGSVVRRLSAAVAGCVVAAGLAAVSSGATSVPAGTPSAAAPRTAPSGGMYGELGGAPVRTVPQAKISTQARASSSSGGTTDNYNDGGDTVCGVYANQAGMGSYCTSGTGGGTLEPLIDRYPGMKFENCRYEDPPPGVQVPENPSPDEEMWQLRTCLTAINWFEWDGGDDRRIIMDLVLVDKDMDTTYHDTELSDFLWNSRQTMYPLPMLRVEPKTFPLANQEAYFTFDWFDPESRDTVNEGPYENVDGGGPFVRHVNRGMVMQARATSMRIDPKIEGMPAKTCSPDPRKLAYDESKPPRHEEQRSDCYFVFERSSAAAPEISTADAYLEGDRFVFRPEITVTWEVSYSRRGGGMQPLGGGYDMLVKQDLTVLDGEAVNFPVPDSVIE
ncbi:hypothetical protein [Solicola gregarius]|uniref:Uncharacterized protein n=1 Tax=Solicola gregarius TaxID=2908642 RepID=A0AA46TJV2_9ACTN|nr:hypothetical protein [Solicola gregarius]UYM06684.1 hypothetical protein L0C25_06330 [Solicola gregarius]